MVESLEYILKKGISLLRFVLTSDEFFLLNSEVLDTGFSGGGGSRDM